MGVKVNNTKDRTGFLFHGDAIMENTKTSISIKKHSVGDSAVSGLFAGLSGGAAMAAVIAGFSLLAGQGIYYLGNFSNGTPVPVLQGLLMHLAMSGIYGMLYGLIHRQARLGRFQRLPGWLAGLGYALVLWAFAVTVLLPAAHSLILASPWYVFFSGHLAYGAVLGARQKA
jgi:hypothetical protein